MGSKQATRRGRIENELTRHSAVHAWQPPGAGGKWCLTANGVGHVHYTTREVEVFIAGLNAEEGSKP